MTIRKTIEVGSSPLIIETGQLAKQADGSVTVPQLPLVTDWTTLTLSR